MEQQHPITPSPELIKDWHDEWNESDQIVHSAYTHIAIRAAQWGADMELEACCEWMAPETPDNYINALRAARRPKPPSLKEQALEMLEITRKGGHIGSHAAGTIRRALEQLPDNE